MKDENIRKMWEEFIGNDKYKKYFLSNEEIWKDNLEKIKEYIDQNKKKPSSTDKNEDIRSLGQWLCNQLTNYKNNEHIMKDENIRKMWEEFTSDERYKEYFLSNEEIWKDNLEKIKEYIDKYKKRPSDKDKDIKYIGKWLYSQTQNYKNNEHIMKDENIRKMWEEFIGNDKYKKYFK